MPSWTKLDSELLSTDLDSYSTETHVPGRQNVKLDSSTDLDTVTELDKSSTGLNTKYV